MNRKLLITIILVMCIFIISCSTTAPPVISEEALSGSTELILTNPQIEDAEVIVENDKLKFYIVKNKEIDMSQDELRKLGEDYVRLLGGYTANDEIKGPTGESYGEIYEFYDLEIYIEGERGALIGKGIKTKNENNIKWEE